MKSYTSDKKPPRPFFTTSTGQNITLGTTARRTLNKYHSGGSWVYDSHVVGGRIYESHYLVGATWHGELAIIYRVRRGNGSHGAKLGVIYQDQFPYFVPTSINNAQGAAARTAFAQAVYNWQNVLDEDTKIEYNRAAARKGNLTGYNLYIGIYVKENA